MPVRTTQRLLSNEQRNYNTAQDDEEKGVVREVNNTARSTLAYVYSREEMVREDNALHFGSNFQPIPEAKPEEPEKNASAANAGTPLLGRR